MDLHLRGVTCRMVSQCYPNLPATSHKWTHSPLTQARQAGTQFTYPGGMEGWVDVGECVPRWYTASQAVMVEVSLFVYGSWPIRATIQDLTV